MLQITFYSNFDVNLIIIMGALFPKITDQTRKITLGLSINPFSNNHVETSKYSLLTFLPKALILQFLRLSNVVFLVNAILQSITLISSLSPFTAIGPLAFVLIISLLRQAYEDYKRHKKDLEINTRKTLILRRGNFQEAEWQQIKVGDIIKVCNGEIIPADILLLHSSEENSICYVQTSNLDGENNLKQKYAFTEGINMYPNQYEDLEGMILVDIPQANLYEFNGAISLKDHEQKYLTYQNLILRETSLKNTDQIVGVALYCGYDTKIVKNQGSVHHKMSRVEEKINRIQVGLVLLLILMCATCSFGYYFIHIKYNLRTSNSYIPLIDFSLTIQSGLVFLTSFLLLNFLIPITLNIVIQGIKTFSGVFLTLDKKMYDKTVKKGCGVLNTSIVQELGVIDYILTDKTGTLTANQMVFKNIVIKQNTYTAKYIQKNIENLSKMQDFHNFWIGVLICHDVVKDFVKNEFQGSSPDEVCFINYANTLGYIFLKRTKTSIQLVVQGEKRVFELLDIIPFSPRKRMSVIVRDSCKENEILIYTKGADTCIFNKAVANKFQSTFQNNLNILAKQGLRTLVFSMRHISETEYKSYLMLKESHEQKIRKKLLSKNQVAQNWLAIIESMQSNLSILGATSIEDKLQEQVPETISRLEEAGIKVMMITGDKLETAENIGYLAQLIQPSFMVFKIRTNEPDIQIVVEDIIKYLTEVPNSPTSVIIQGASISKIIDDNDPYHQYQYIKIFSTCKSIIFCRSSPKQKALIVKFVKERIGGVVLAIGDGGNDVGMIEQAHVGVGIIGKEGNSAATVSDFNFAKFKFLDRLVLHHGRWFYYRLAYFFVYFGWKNIIITFIIYLFLIDCAFSGAFNYSQAYFTLYNSFFAIGLCVNFGLYEQDINDDLYPEIWKDLPKIYAETKKKQLFSYQRYFIWAIVGAVIAVCLYYFIYFAFNPIYAINSDGMVPDIKGTKILNGLTLLLIVSLVIFFDTKTHTILFEVLVIIIVTLIPTALFFFLQNFVPAFIDTYMGYTQNLNFKFWLQILLICMLSILIKTGLNAFWMQYQPSIIDQFLMNQIDNNMSTSSSKSILKKEDEVQQLHSIHVKYNSQAKPFVLNQHSFT